MNAVMQRLETLAETMANNEIRALLRPLEELEPNPDRLSKLAKPIEKAREEYTDLMIAWRKECLVRKVSDTVLEEALKSVSARTAPLNTPSQGEL